MKKLHRPSGRWFGVAAGALLAAVATALSAAALAGAATPNGNAAEVLVGHYAGSTDQNRDVRLWVERKGADLVVAEFHSSLVAQCHQGTSTMTFSSRSNAAIASDGRVEFTTDGVTVAIGLGGAQVSGNLSYSSAGCHASIRFTAYHDPAAGQFVRAGRYNGGNTDRQEVEMRVEKRGAYFVLTHFTSVIIDCQGQDVGIDASPDALIEGNGQADFKTLSNRVKVEISFHTRVHARGRIQLTHGSCDTDSDFVARFKP